MNKTMHCNLIGGPHRGGTLDLLEWTLGSNFQLKGLFFCFIWKLNCITISLNKSAPPCALNITPAYITTVGPISHVKMNVVEWNTQPKGVHVDVSALGIHFLFIGVSKVLGRIAREVESAGRPDLAPAKLATSWCTAAWQIGEQYHNH